MSTYRFKTKPYAHQKLGIRHVFRQWGEGLGAALLFDPRTGKTKTSIDAVSILHQRDGVNRVLVICPNRVMGTWVTEFHAHCPFNVQCIIWDAKGRRRPLPKRIAPYDIQVVIVNFDAFSTPGKRLPSGRRSRKTGRLATREKIRAWLGGHDAVAIVDEGHKIKSPSGKSSTAIVSMRKDFRYRLLLTGTPVTKAHRAHDIYMQWQWVNPDRFRKWAPDAETFRNRVGVWTERNGFPQFLRGKPKGVEYVRKGMHKDGLVVIREECFDLPARMPDRIIPVTLGAKTRKAYNDMADTMIAEIEEGIIAEASIPIVVMLRLQQITGGFVGITDQDAYNATGARSGPARTHRIGSDKLKALEELLIEEYLERDSDEKVIVAAKYVRDLDDIVRLAFKLEIPLFTIRGGVSRGETDEAIVKFRKHRGMGMMLVQPDAASLGIDLSTSSHMIWYSLTNSWVNWTQCCDRIALSNNHTTFTYLQVPGSVDQLMYEGLLNDTNMARYIKKRPKELRLKK